MKKFVMREARGDKHIVKIDDKDAYLLRNYAWSMTRHAGGITVQRYVSGEHVQLACKIYGDQTGLGVFYVHANGDQLDFTRENLVRMNKNEFFAFMRSRAKAKAKQAADRKVLRKAAEDNNPILQPKKQSKEIAEREAFRKAFWETLVKMAKTPARGSNGIAGRRSK